MDYTKIRREFIYRERRSLEEFADEQEENVLFIDNMLDSYYFSSADGKERALRCFNTAYYICTLILLSNKHPEWNFGRYCDIAYCGNKGNKVYQSFTLSLVYIFLTHTYYEVQCKKLLKKLEDFFVEYQNALRLGDTFLSDYTYKDVCHDLLKDTPYNLLILEEFKPRKIDKDIFKEVDGPGDIWSRLTNCYDGHEVRMIVDALGKNEEEKHVLIELINRDAQRFYGRNGDYYLETVKPMLEEMDELIYHKYNDAANQAIVEAEIEELQYQGDVRPLQARIAELEKEVDNLKKQLSDYATDDDVNEIFNDDEQGYPQEDKQSQTENLNSEGDSHPQELSDALKKIEEQKETIKDLNETIRRYQMRKLPPAKRKGIALGLTPLQADIFGNYLADKLGIVFDNKKEELSLILNCLFGYGRSSLANKMHMTTGAVDDRLYVASIFGPFSPSTAKAISSDWKEDTPAPWDEDGENNDNDKDESD